jgi:aspartyl protease family protein
MRLASYLIICLLTAGTTSLDAAGDIHVVALFKNRAVVVIDGKQQLLRVDESSPEGVTLVSADSSVAVFEYQGKKLERRLDGRTKAPAANLSLGETVHVYRDNRSMFRTVGSINGLPVGFLIDTGASSVAMNSAQARRLGIDFRVQGDSTYVTTASQVVQAFHLTLERVKVGSIELRNVEGIVIDGPQPDEVLLGMSFLGRLDMRNDGARMSLRKKY